MNPPPCRRQPLAIAVLAVSALVLACAPGPAGSAPAAAPPAAPAAAPAATAGASRTAAPPLPVKAAYSSVAAAVLPWWVAADGGYFREQELDVELTYIAAGATLVAALHSGELDITHASGAPLVLGYLQGLETMIIGATSNNAEVGVYVRPEIQTPEDLRGKTIAVNRPKAITDVIARLAFERVGLRPDVDVFTQGTGGQAEALAAMEVGAMAGAALSVPATFEARKRGYHEIFNIAGLGVRYLGSAVGAPRRTLDQQPEIADRTLRALAQATSRIQTDRDYAIEILGKYSQSSDRELMSETVDFFRPRYATDLYPDPSAVQAVIDAEDHPAAPTTRAAETTDLRFVERLRGSGFLDRLPR